MPLRERATIPGTAALRKPGPDAVEDLYGNDAPPSRQEKGEDPADGQSRERYKEDRPVVAALGGFFRKLRWWRRNKAQRVGLTPMVQIDVLEKPIERIKETCAMMGIAEKFDRALPDLETFLEAEVAKGETRETRLTYDGLLYLKQLLAKG